MQTLIGLLILETVAMKYYTILCSIMILMLACNSSPLQKHLDKADGLVVKFNDLNNKDSIIKIVKTTDEKAIEKIIGFVDSERTGNIKCGYTGVLQFMQGETELQKVDFNTQNNCSYFSYSLKNELVTTKMNNEAADFFNALFSGRNFY